MRSVAIVVLLAGGITGCSSRSPAPSAHRTSLSPAPRATSASEVAGEVLPAGGMWPGHVFRPRTSTLVVLSATGKVIRRVTVTSGIFRLTLPKGAYRIGAHTDRLWCGPLQAVSIPRTTAAPLRFSCSMK
ncbi:hypothetical protein [Actinoallomurus iriomotensis]|uniref:Uncharacterized protein n=1 Tax=Actinoallomurus iriomotensis TaxID=478107 RepID=A0A9W6VMC7_9ACTN|nr:hypothetical protein [Actinoallomurus iriomotensis]GLY72337.1 hypothetical protein Airi01_006040 [Actinoallomurus iriomotensis]